MFPLAEIASVSAGDPAPQVPDAFSDDGPNFVRMQDVGRDHINPNLNKTTDRLNPTWLQNNRLRLFPKGSLLIPKSGASVNLNHRAMLAVDAYVVSHLAVVTPKANVVDPEFLFWWSVKYDPRAQVQVTSLPSLKASILKEALVPLPPIEEQRRIVGILNRAASIERLRHQVSAHLRDFVPALFLKMFGDPIENPMGWETSAIGDTLQMAQYGSSKKANASDEAIPVLRMGNVGYDGYLDCSDLKYVELSDADLEKYLLAKGDLLFNRTNSKELVGKTGIWDGRFTAIAASYFIRLRVDAQVINPTYLWAFMNTTPMKSQLFGMARGAIGQSNINAQELQAITVPLPPLERQKAFAGLVDTAKARMSMAGGASELATNLSRALLDRLLGVQENNTTDGAFADA